MKAASALASHTGIDTRAQFAVEALVLAAVGAAVAQLLVEDPTTTDAPAPPERVITERTVQFGATMCQLFRCCWNRGCRRHRHFAAHD